MLSPEEKVENARAYFGLLSDAEKRKGGVNSYRAVLTVKSKGAVNDHEMREAVNDFLRENFPLAQALVAIHRNTGHVHAHLYVHSRQLDGRKIHLGQDYFRLDERWSKVCSEHFNDRAIHDDHMRLKSETQEWKRQRAQAVKHGQCIPAKSGRWSDYYEVKHGMVRPWDDNWVGRLKAVARVAETKAEYLKVTHAPEPHVTEANHEVQELQQRLQSVSEKRLHARSEAKRKMPAEVITIEEQKELARQSQTIRAATTARQISVTNEPLPLQAVFDFRKSPVEQLALDFCITRAEKVAGKQIDTKDRKPKAKSEIKSESTELRPEKNVAESLVPGKEIPYEIQIQQMKAREQELRATHDAAISGLRLISQKEGAIPSPQEFTRAQSESLRQELFEKHGYSIHDLGYTRENWATIVLNRVSEALRRESVNHPNFAFAKALLCQIEVRKSFTLPHDRTACRREYRIKASEKFFEAFMSTDYIPNRIVEDLMMAIRAYVGQTVDEHLTARVEVEQNSVEKTGGARGVSQHAGGRCSAQEETANDLQPGITGTN